jgi:hypothetical protein
MSDMYVPSEGVRRNGSRDGHLIVVALFRLAVRPFVWLMRGARFVVFAAFSVLEPVISLVLWAVSALMIGSALILRMVGPPDFPFWGMMSVGLGSATLLAIYYVVIRWLAPR